LTTAKLIIVKASCKIFFNATAAATTTIEKAIKTTRQLVELLVN